MTAKRRLIPTAEVAQHIEMLRKLGVAIGSVDIRADGVTVYPPNQAGGGNDYDRSKAREQVRDRAARR